MARKASEGCGPQLLDNQIPNDKWGVDELGEYAQSQYQRLLEGEKSLSAHYWRLGWALVLARRNFSHGQWEKYLEQLGIDKTRAAKARAIHETFVEEEEVAALSVEEAYKQRKRKTPQKNLKKENSTRAHPLKRFLANVSKQADALLDKTAFVEPADAAQLIPDVQRAMQELAKILAWLQSKESSAIGIDNTTSISRDGHIT